MAEPEKTPVDASTEADAAMAVPTTRRGATVDKDARKRGMLLVIPLVTAAAAIVGIVLAGMKDNAIYAKPVDQLMAEKAKYAGRPVRAEGNLVNGTLVRRDQPCEYRFRLSKNGTELPVKYAGCIVPDTLKDIPGMPVSVTVEGQLATDNSFEATNVLAKCPSKYEEQMKNGKPLPYAAGTDPGAGVR
jgi:cytochrome c-type biogenesis protein CcmE